jgi:predicted metal-dependent hydrolase
LIPAVLKAALREALSHCSRGLSGVKRGVQFDFFHKQPSVTHADSIVLGDRKVPLRFVVNPRARRYVLRVRPDGSARVTVPRRGSLRAARDFAERNSTWIADQLQRLASRPVRNTAWEIGSEVLFRGELVRIAVDVESGALRLADQTIKNPGAGADVRPIVERHLRSLAMLELSPRVIQFAQQHGLTVRRVTVRDQKSRWGSCSPRGTISLNWRLIQTPLFVSDYIILHELMHLRQMNHSRRFWREVEAVCPDFRTAERWLKTRSSILR